MRRYLNFWLIATLGILLLVGVFNLLVDPYGLFRIVDRAGFNAVKPKSGAHGDMVKAYQVLRVHPQALILGNSRAEVGFDPMHPAWPVQPVYNLALPGTGTETTLRYLRHVLNNGQPKPAVVVWGLDFMDFLVDRAAPARPSVSDNPRLLSNQHDYTTRALQQLRDDAEATLTLGAFFDSIKTLSSQHDPYSGNLTPLGFNPMRDYLKITAEEGYRAVFRQKNLDNTRAYLHRPADILDGGGRSSPALEDLRAVIRLCRQNGIDLRLIIYPYHADLLEIIRITGHAAAFEAWKRAVVAVVSDANASGDKPIPLWDFGRFNEITAEAVPSTGDRQSRMRWYWESGHFKRELGDLVLARVFGVPGSPPGFGVLLNPANVEAELVSDRLEEHAYRLSHVQEPGELENMAVKLQALPLRQ